MAQRVLITAGASGIGREIARAFAANGAKVFVCDIDAAGLEKLAGKIPGLTIGPCDVSRREEIKRMMAEAAQALGGIDVLINNAGIAGRPPSRSRSWSIPVTSRLWQPFWPRTRARRSRASSCPSTTTCSGLEVTTLESCVEKLVTARPRCTR